MDHPSASYDVVLDKVVTQCHRLDQSAVSLLCAAHNLLILRNLTNELHTRKRATVSGYTGRSDVQEQPGTEVSCCCSLHVGSAQVAETR